MTLADLIKTICNNSSAVAISFGAEGRLELHGLGRMLKDALPRVLAERSEIHSGWSSGKAMPMWLIADDGLVKIVPTPRLESSNDYQIVDVAISLLPLAEAQPPVVTLTYHKDRLCGAHVRLVVENETIEAGSWGAEYDDDVVVNVKAAAHFISKLVEAMQRAQRAPPGMTAGPSASAGPPEQKR